MRDFPAGDPFVSLIAPELRAGGASSHAPTGSDALGVTPPTSLAFDALTDLFLGGSAGTAIANGVEPSPVVDRVKAATPAHASDAPTIEILIAGHLPVMASAWVQQYARDRASAIGAPIALVDLRTSRAWMQVLDPRAGGSGAFIAQVGATFPAALRAVKNVAGLWMIRVDESDEAAMRAATPGANVTLLSGADQAATVGAYRAIKRLAASARPERITIAVMGSSGVDADTAVERVGAAAKSFLNITVVGSSVSSKVDASVRPVTAFAGPLPTGGAHAAIKLLAETLAPVTPRVQEDDDADDVVATPEVTTLVATPPLARPPIDPPAPAPTTKSATAPISDPIAAPFDAPIHVLVAGLEPIPVRCPVAPGVKLASDAQGRLHIIAIDLDAAGETVAPYVERLLTASAWATENQELLHVAFPRLKAGDRAAAAPVLHLAVDQPKRVRHLLDTPVKLHVLASPGQGSRGWVSRPLN